MDQYEKPKRDHPNPRNAPCPICGGTRFEWGSARAQGGVVYLPQDKWFGFGFGEPLNARKCLACRNVQLFTHP
jgi:hypothetical protein